MYIYLYTASQCYDGSDTTCPIGSIYNDLPLTDFDAQLATSLTVLGILILKIIYSNAYKLIYSSN